MALLAITIGTTVIQWEAVIGKRRRFPGRCFVALRAVGTELAVVRVILRMATVAIFRRTGELSALMTRIATLALVLSGEREAGLVVVECHIFPTPSVMAGGTIGAELPLVRIFIRMATVAVFRRTGELSALMTRIATLALVLSGEREAGLVVVECHIFPTPSVMAGGTIGAELAVVRVILRMATEAIFRRTFELPVGVARGTGLIDMRTGERECSFVVVKGDVAPFCWRMALSTIGAELAVMMVIFLVTTEAVFGCPLEHVVHMACFTFDVIMCAHQFETCRAVVEGHIFPIRRIMTELATCAELSIVIIIFFVATEAVLRCGLQFRQAGCTTVTIGASSFGMLAFQPEADSIMVE